jgi:hypothetical protein
LRQVQLRRLAPDSYCYDPGIAFQRSEGLSPDPLLCRLVPRGKISEVNQIGLAASTGPCTGDNGGVGVTPVEVQSRDF